MFAGIRSSLKGAPQRQVQLAEQNLDNPRCATLKALFLEVRRRLQGNRAEPDRVGLQPVRTRPPALQEQVREGLALLEQQTYVQRTGETYAYLTNEEQDIEKEIKNVEVDGSEVSDRLFQLLYLHVMKQQSKFRYSKDQPGLPAGLHAGRRGEGAVEGSDHPLHHGPTRTSRSRTPTTSKRSTSGSGQGRVAGDPGGGQAT
jgi:hypothetical protein